MRGVVHVGVERTTQIILVSTWSSQSQTTFTETALSQSCFTHFSVQYSVQYH